jgi:hypothetical protein
VSRRALGQAAVALVLAALGAELACYSALLSPTGPRIGASQPFGFGLLVALVGVPVSVALGLLATRRRLLAAVPLLSWLVVVLAASSRSADGSVVLAGGPFQLSSSLVTVGGLLAGALALGALPTLLGVRAEAALGRPDRHG